MFFVSPPFGNYLAFKNCISIKGSYTLEPRDGLFWQIVKTLRYSFEHGGWINKIGLRNVGLDEGVRRYLENKASGGYEEVVSIAICDKMEIPKIIEKIPEDMNIEINVSCPNHNIFRGNKNERPKFGLERFLNNKRKWCIIKLSPMEPLSVVDHYYDAGFRQFHCSNTFPIHKTSGNGERAYVGGLSGPFLRPYTGALVSYLSNKEGVEIIAGGGVRTVGDVEQYKKMGAHHVSASSLFFNPFVSGWFWWSYILHQ